MSYGIYYNRIFDPSKHQQADKFWSETHNDYLADNQMKWFLKEVFWVPKHLLALDLLLTYSQGDDVSSKRPVRHDFVRLYSEPLGDVSDSIHSSLASPAPERRDYTVERLCTVKWNKQVKLESLPTYTNPIGKVYHELRYTVEMTCEDGTIDFAVYHDGKRVGAQNVEVEFD